MSEKIGILLDKCSEAAARLNLFTDYLSKDIIYAFEKGATQEGMFKLGMLYKDLRDLHTDLIFIGDE